MQTVVSQSRPSARSHATRITGGIGGDAADAPSAQKFVDRWGKPTGMSRLADELIGKFCGHCGEESGGCSRLERQARRELNENDPQLASQCTDLVQKVSQLAAAIVETAVVGDGARHLYREREVIRS